MSYNATIFKVMIASPGDVSMERGIVRDVLAEWNAIHSEGRESSYCRSDGKPTLP
jgi:hypothetical protein